MKASPSGSQDTIPASSFPSISISFLGNGLEPPVGVVLPKAGEPVAELVEEELMSVLGEIVPDAVLVILLVTGEDESVLANCILGLNVIGADEDRVAGSVSGGCCCGGGGGGAAGSRICAARNPAKYMALSCACFSSSDAAFVMDSVCIAAIAASMDSCNAVIFIVVAAAAPASTACLVALFSLACCSKLFVDCESDMWGAGIAPPPPFIMLERALGAGKGAGSVTMLDEGRLAGGAGALLDTVSGLVGSEAMSAENSRMMCFFLDY